MQDKIGNPVVFVVGPDGSGKTNVTLNLEKELGLRRFKCPSEKELFKNNAFLGTLGFDVLLPDFVQQMGIGFISDRGFPCEWVYSQVFERGTDFEALKKIDEKWSKQNAYIVLLTRRDYSNIEDDIIPTEKLSLIQYRYEEYLDKHSSLKNVMLCTDDYGAGWVDAITNEIIDFISANRLPTPILEIDKMLYDVANGVSKIPYVSSSSFEKKLRKGYLQLMCGNSKGAAKTLFDVSRELLPSNFWETLGRSW